MKKRKVKLLYLLSLAVLAVALYCWITIFSTEPDNKDNIVRPRKSESIKNSAGRFSGEKEDDSATTRIEGFRILRPTMEEYEEMFNTPVEVYGVILDQFDNPVVGAKIKCYVPPIGSLDSPLELVSSDPSGEFEIKGITAFTITVTISPPDGYDLLSYTNRSIVIAKAPERILKSEEFNKLPEGRRERMVPIIGKISKKSSDKTNLEVFRLKKRQGK